jgi:hypothetical protein
MECRADVHGRVRVECQLHVHDAGRTTRGANSKSLQRVQLLEADERYAACIGAPASRRPETIHMPMPILEPTVLLGSPQCVLQLPARAEPPRRERAEDGPRREPRERDDR